LKFRWLLSPSRYLLVILAPLLLIGCGFAGGSQFFPDFLGVGSESNGERIYFTATNNQGKRIRYSGDPPFGGIMMGNSLTCASCHGHDGRGGVHTMHMQVMDAPDIRWSNLSSGDHGDHGGGADADHKEGTYDRDSFFRAIRDGIEPGGNSLSTDMPRWFVSEDDLDDLLHFLESLP
jgi:hypothetical protein